MPPRAPRERKHISPSEVRAFLSCPAKWWFQYRLGLWTSTTTPYFALGNAVHAGLERWYYPKDQHNAEAALAEYRKRAGLESANVPWEDFPKADPVTVRADGEKLFAAGIAAEDSWMPAQVETTLYADIVHSRKGKLPVPLKVRPDMVIEGEEVPTDYDFVDHKTADKTWEVGKEHHELQATAFTMAGRQNHGHDPRTIYNVLVNNKVAVVDRRVTTRNQDDIDQFYTFARMLLDADEKQVVYPNPTSFGHSTCEYLKLCANWEGDIGGLIVPDGKPLQVLVKGISDRNAGTYEEHPE